MSVHGRAQVRAGRCWGGVRAKCHVDLHAPASTGRGPRGQGPGHRCGQRHRRVCPEVRQPDRLRVCGLKYDACSSARGCLTLTNAGSMLVKCTVLRWCGISRWRALRAKTGSKVRYIRCV
eukprot:scaffold77556_cov92-Phaeocystis_antarctica.AAC.1